MASAKPVALSANFLRAVRSCRPQTYRSIRFPPSSQHQSSNLHTSPCRLQQESTYQRYGPAATENLPPPSKPTEPFLPSTEQTRKDATESEVKSAQSEDQQEEPTQTDQEKRVEEAPETEIKAAEPVPSETNSEIEEQEKPAEDVQKAAKPDILAGDDTPLGNRELDMVLSIPSPSEIKGGISADGTHHQHPHIDTPPYEHHFDTYTLVQELTQNDQVPGAEPNTNIFTPEQSVTLMKAIRMMLAQNLEVAKEGLVSKSDTENETYLFRAACSELKTTMQTSRFMEAQKQRSQRAQLQHEFDILNQKVTQDIMTMREELKGMFNDRKLGLQEDKRRVDGKISQLTYSINVDLNSEARSEVEGLRWVLTRRAALAIGTSAAMIISFLQYYSVKSREQAEIEKKRKAAKAAQDEQMAREQARFTTPARSAGTQTDEALPTRDFAESLG